MQATNYLMRAILNLARGTDMTAPNSFHLALFRSDPTATGTAGTEISYTGYARQVITFGASNSTSSGYIANLAQINFGQVPRGVTQTVTHVAVMDAATGGNMYLYAPLAESVPLGDTLKIYFNTASLKWTFSGIFASEYRQKFLLFFKNLTSISGFTPYLALYNASGTEKSSGSYARQQCAMTLTTSQNKISNTSAIDFPVATANWSTVAQAAIVDAATGGSKYATFTLSESFTAPTGSQIRVNAGAISIQWQDPE